MRLTRASLGIRAALLIALAAPATAQPTATFADLATRLKPGQTVKVDDAGGRRLVGRVVTATPEALVVDTGADTVRLGADEVRELAVRGDSLVNGTLVGLAAGAVVGGAIGGSLPVWDRPGIWGESRTENAFQGGLILGAIGAGLGLCLDAIIRSDKVMYRSNRALTVVPFGTRRGAALVAAVRW